MPHYMVPCASTKYPHVINKPNLYFQGVSSFDPLLLESSLESESHSVVSDSVIPWATQSMEFSRPEY